MLFDTTGQFEYADVLFCFFLKEVIRMFERVSQAEECALIKGFCFQLYRADLKSPFLPLVQTAHNWECSLQEPEKPFSMRSFSIQSSQAHRTRPA